MKKALRIIANKYVITLALFGVWMLYFDQYDYFMMKEKKQQLNNLKHNISYLEREITKMDKERVDMVTDNAKLEEYAREHYYMKRDNEDLYVIEK